MRARPAAHRAARLALLLLDRGACQRGPVPARPGAGPGRRAHHLAGPGLLLAGFLAAIGADRDAARALLEQDAGLAGQLNDPATRAFAARAAGQDCSLAGDLPQATTTTKKDWQPSPRPPSATAWPDRHGLSLRRITVSRDDGFAVLTASSQVPGLSG